MRTLLHSLTAAFALLAFSACPSLKALEETVEFNPPGPIPEALIKRLKNIQAFGLRRMEIGTLTGLEPYNDQISVQGLHFDSLEIVLDSLSFNSMRIDKSGLLVMDLLRMPLLNMASSEEPLTEGVPYDIRALHFKEIILRYRGEELRRLKYQEGYQVNNFSIDRYNFRKKELREIERDSLKVKIEDLEMRLERLRKLIQDILAKQPDHAVQLLPAAIDDIQAGLQRIKEWYRTNLPDLPSLHRDRTRMFSFEMRVEDMEMEVEYPDEVEIIKSQILFGPGRYRISDLKEPQELHKVIRKIENQVKKLQTLRPDRLVEIYLVVTGYADDRPVGDTLDDHLYLDVTDIPPGLRNSKTEAEQDFLNLLLSRKRAASVLEFIRKKITASMGNKLVIKSGSSGKGRTSYPAHIPEGSCPGKCDKRRVVIISEVEITQGKD